VPSTSASSLRASSAEAAELTQINAVIIDEDPQISSAAREARPVDKISQSNTALKDVSTKRSTSNVSVCTYPSHNMLYNLTRWD
jgi:hypothetical protein